MSSLAVLIASTGYLGFFPIAPGTVGSAAGVVILAAIRYVWPEWNDLGSIAIALAAGVWSASETERALARTDPGPVVIDEVLGMFITLAFLPMSLPVAAAGFVLFRVCDVLKPFPANRAERLHGGWGIMLDDAIAGVYAHVALRLAIFAVPGLFS